MREKSLIAVLSIVLISCVACNKDDDKIVVTGNVEMYLLESYETVDNSAQIKENTIVLKENPIIQYTDFISYDKSNHIFTISEESKQTIQNLNISVSGLAFAVVADDIIIYSGYFWPATSSAICNWIVIDPLYLYSGNELKVELGYPDQIDGELIPDKRNNNLLLNIFRRDNKLIE